MSGKTARKDWREVADSMLANDRAYLERKRVAREYRAIESREGNIHMLLEETLIDCLHGAQANEADRLVQFCLDALTELHSSTW